MPTSISCRALTLPEVRAAPRIPSGYVTDRVLRMKRDVHSSHLAWGLEEHVLGRTLEKIYDNGDVDDWLQSYGENAAPSAMRFIGAYDSTDLVGLVTWTHSEWNNSVWLADIRVRRDRQRTGTGSHLMRYLQLETTKVRGRGIRLETQISNYPAIQFYRKHGFVPCGLDDHLYSNRDMESGEVALFLFWERT